jgi:G:T-mismatch repair DNA endonuclease (very short patch repair protein)
LTKDEALYNKRCYIYDFYLPKFNLIIECHGLFWHAHPSLYNENSILDFPKGKIKASDIWNADSYKMKIAKKRNHNYLIIWENEIDNTIDLINERVNID